MSKKFRDYLLWVFVALFVLITVVTSLYASGYKFNLSWPLKLNRLLQKTGMLAVATEPKNAIVYLNDKPQNDLSINPWKKDYIATPAKIKNLLPGEYELRFKTEGYWPYKQKINIYSGETTFVEDVNLFKDNSPLLILSLAEDKLIISPDNKYIYAQKSKKIINLKAESVRDLNILNLDENSNFNDSRNLWLKNNKLFIDGIIFDPTKETGDSNYYSSIGSRATNWTIDDSQNYLYYQNNNSINKLNTNSKKSSIVVSGEIYLDYEFGQNKLFTIRKTEKQIELSAKSLDNTDSQKDIWIMPSSGHYRFSKRMSSYLTIYDDQNKTLYLFDENNLNKGPLTIRNINKWALYNNQALIYTNDLEIYIFNFSNSRSDLITRRSEKIEDIFWNSEGNYLILSSFNNLSVFDFKNRNTTVLLSAEKISSPVFDAKNNSLYFWARINEQEGVYKMLMQ